jgi:uncharacterized protein YceK
MRRMLAIAYAVSTVVLAGCGSDGSTDPTQNLGGDSALIGTWNLTTVNGAALPLLLQESDPKVELMSDQLVVLGNGKFTRSLLARFTDGSDSSTQTYPDSGTYKMSGSSAIFTFTDGSGGMATLAGNRMTVSGTGIPFVYQRQ